MAITFPSVLDTDIDFAVDDVVDLPAQLAVLRQHKPAVWGLAFGQPAVAFLSHDLVRAAFSDEDTFPSAEFYGSVVTEVLGRNLQCLHGAEHRRNRALVSPAFRQRLMPGLIGPLLEPLANELIDRFEPRGRADLVAEFTSIYPFLIITRLLGLPRHSEETVKHWALAMLDIQQHYDLALQCSREFMAFVDPILQARRHYPGDDLLSTLATAEVEGERLSDAEIFDFLRLLFPAGADTTYLGLGSAIYGLLSHPDQLQRVAAQPATHCRWAAEEGVRWYPPTAWIPRKNPHDVVWNDVAIPQGASMMLGILAANRDPAVYDRPDEFDVARHPTNTMTFGFGPHFCLGAHLARAEMETALRVLLERLPRLRLEGGEDIRITGSFVQILQGPTHLPVRFD
jgi:cytochrome P450